VLARHDPGGCAHVFDGVVVLAVWPCCWPAGCRGAVSMATKLQDVQLASPQDVATVRAWNAAWPYENLTTADGKTATVNRVMTRNALAMWWHAKLGLRKVAVVVRGRGRERGRGRGRGWGRGRRRRRRQRRRQRPRGDVRDAGPDAALRGAVGLEGVSKKRKKEEGLGVQG
jgi:hypothetical protein